MRNETINLYTFNELSDTAQQTALYDYQSIGNYPWSSDNKASFKAFANLFPVTIRDWSYGGRGEGVTWSFTESDEIEQLAGIRLLTYIHNNYFHDLYKGKYYSLWSKTEVSPTNPSMGKLKTRYSKIMKESSCVLTGYYIDDAMLQPIYTFLKKPSANITFKELLDDCFDEWVKACSHDMEHYYSMESFAETCEANEWEFTEDGKMF